MFKLGLSQRLKSRPVGYNGKDRQDLVCAEGKVKLPPSIFFSFFNLIAGKSCEVFGLPTLLLYAKAEVSMDTRSLGFCGFSSIAFTFFALNIYIKRACLPWGLPTRCGQQSGSACLQIFWHRIYLTIDSKGKSNMKRNGWND